MLYTCAPHQKKDCRQLDCMREYFLPIVARETQRRDRLVILHREWMSPLTSNRERAVLIPQLQEIATTIRGNYLHLFGR